MRSSRRGPLMGLLLGALLTIIWLGASIATIPAKAEEPSPRQVLERAKALEEEKQYEEAIASYRQYLAVRPNNDEVRATTAKLLSWQGRWDDAVALFRDVLTRHPLDHDTRVGLARVLSWQKQFDEARKEYDLILRDEPNYAEALTGIGDIFLWSGHREQAIPYYESVVAATGDTELAARLQALKSEVASPSAGASGAVLPDPSSVPTLDPVPTDGRSAMERGRRLELMRQPVEAASVYREGLEQFPENDELRGALARILSWQGAHAEAVRLYRDVLTRHPEDQEIRVALAQVLSWQKEFDEAHHLYAQVLEADPTQIEARRGLAEVAHWRGDRQEALQRYEALLAETHDPAIEQQLRAVRSELLVSPRAAVGQGLTGLRLPYRDYAKIGYGHYSYTKNQPDERNLLFEIAKPFGNQTFVMRVEPINRFGFHDTPFSAELYSPLWQRAWGYVAAQGTINPNFSPNYSVVGEVAQGLGGLHASLAPFEVSFGYRRLNYKQDDIDLLMPGLTIFLPFNLWLTEKIYFIPNTGAVTLASQLTWRPTDRLQFFASGSFGTSGERIVAAQDFTRVGSRTIQGGVTFPINERFSAEASGYYEDRGFLYVRRGGSVNLIYHW
ncbi:MAG: tetratricopeptide repeat protein [Nitrospira sp.]|nr:tetratricopeptide repeat protein [Nitrospira sp.]